MNQTSQADPHAIFRQMLERAIAEPDQPTFCEMLNEIGSFLGVDRESPNINPEKRDTVPKAPASIPTPAPPYSLEMRPSIEIDAFKLKSAESA